MDVVLYTRQASYYGVLTLPVKVSVDGQPTLVRRLQDILNNPALLYSSTDQRSRQILLENVTVIVAAGEKTVASRLPSLYIDPDFVELVYDAAQKRDPVPEADFERQLANTRQEAVELLTRGAIRITGIVQMGVRQLTAFSRERRFFAVSPARLEFFYTGRRIEEVGYILVNRDCVESFRSLRP